MKIRTDYVTNSSSSSYVIAYRTLPEIDDETLKKYPFLKGYNKLIEKILLTAGDDETSAGEIFKTQEEWDKHIISYYGYRDNDTVKKIIEAGEYSKERYEKSVRCFEKGLRILEKRVDYSNTYFGEMIEELAKDEENFVILDSD